MIRFPISRPKIHFSSKAVRLSAPRPASPRLSIRQTANCNPMILTITQNGALYALQHTPAPSYLQKRVRPDLIWSYRGLTRSIEKVQSTPRNTAEQVAYAFPEYRVGA